MENRQLAGHQVLGMRKGIIVTVGAVAEKANSKGGLNEPTGAEVESERIGGRSPV